MTRSEALHKLLALGPVTRRELSEITRWPETEISKLLQRRVERREIIRYGPRRNRTFELTFEVTR